MPVSYADRLDYVEGSTCLSVRFAWQRRRAGESLPEILSNQVPLYRLTVFNNQEHAKSPADADPRWARALQGLLELFERHKGGEDTGSLERAALALLWSHLEPRIQTDVEAWPKLMDRPFGFFSYDWGKCATGPDWLSLHLANPFAPHSPFEDMPARFRELKALFAAAMAEKPETRQVVCGSWLNGVKPFLTLFPEAWVLRRKLNRDDKPNPGLAWWGQFIDRSGRFHKKNGEYLRTHGVFPFPCSTCACRAEQLGEHLDRVVRNA